MLSLPPSLLFVGDDNHDADADDGGQSVASSGFDRPSQYVRVYV